MQGRKLRLLENARFGSKRQTLIFKITNAIISEAQTALVSALSKLLFSISPSTCTEDSFSHKCLLGSYHVLTVVGNITVNQSDTLPALMGSTFCWERQIVR